MGNLNEIERISKLDETIYSVTPCMTIKMNMDEDWNNFQSIRVNSSQT